MLGKVINIGSSSKGNAFYVELVSKELEKPFGLLIECGFPYPKIQNSLMKYGVSMNDIDAVLVSHEHDDHSTSITQFKKRHFDIYTSESVNKKYELGLQEENILGVRETKEHKTILKKKQIADGIELLAFPVEHVDNKGDRIENYGFIITVDKIQHMLFVIDTKFIESKYLIFLRKLQFNTIFIETNHMSRKFHIMISEAQKKGDDFGVHHYQRILQSHFGLEKAIKTLQTFDLSKTKNIYLTHLSASNVDNPNRFIEQMKLGLENKGRFNISVCRQTGGFIR